MEIQLKIAGWLLCILAVIHVIFPRYFNWSEELKGVSLINRQMMYVHTFFVALTVLGMGMLCITQSFELMHTDLGQLISLGLGIFWFIRLLIQFFGYSPKLWRGKAFETLVHIVFIGLWGWLSTLFLWVYFSPALRTFAY